MFQARPLSPTLACTFLVACASAESDAAAGPAQTEVSTDMMGGDGCGCSTELAKLAQGPAVSALLEHDIFVLFPVQPTLLAKYREAFTRSAAR